MDSKVAEAFSLLNVDVEATLDEVDLSFGRLVAIAIEQGDLHRALGLYEAKKTLAQHFKNGQKEFDQLLKYLNNNNDNVFILGRAGTGKSAFLTELLEREQEGIASCAFTGVAAENINSPTIHSLFRIAGGPGELKGRSKLDQSSLETYRAIKTLIIDEISMAPGWLVDEVDIRLKSALDPNKPFGGVRLIFVGDPLQLAPFIGKSESERELREWVNRNYASPWFFDSKVMTSPDFKFKTFELTNVLRQEDPKLIETLDAIRAGDINAIDFNYLNQRTADKPTKVEVLTIAVTNQDVAFTNQSKLDQIQNEPVKFVGVDTSLVDGETFENPGVSLPVPRELILKVGAQVMFAKNDDQNSDGFKRRWVNGTLGVVTAFSESKKSVFVRIGDDQVVEVSMSTWQRIKYQAISEFDEKQGRFRDKLEKLPVAEYAQIPLALAWAVTINKSQGKTYDRVHIDLGSRAFAPGMAYVALSRVRTYLGMTLERRIERSDIVSDKKAMNFIQWCYRNNMIKIESDRV